MNTLRIAIVLTFCSFLPLFAQEGQLTQFFNSNLYLSPVEAGTGTGPRITSNYRKQWGGISLGFVTKSLNADMRVGKVGLGVLLTANDAGPNTLSRSRFMFDLARQVRLDTHNLVGFGMQMGVVQYNLNTANLQFDNQYVSGQGYSNNVANGENITAANVLNFDGAFGFSWHNMAYPWQPKISFSVLHLLQPKETLLTYSSAVTHRQYNLVVEVPHHLNAKVELIPYLFYARQSQAVNCQIGSRIGYGFKEGKKLYLGAGLRTKDAVMLYTGFALQDVLFGISYDVNNSQLSPATKGCGGWELSLVIQFGKRPGKKTVRALESIGEAGLETQVAVEKEKPIVKDSLILLAKAIHSIEAEIKEIPNPAPVMPADRLLEKPTSIAYGSIQPHSIRGRYFVYFDTDRSIIKDHYKTGLDKMIDELKDDSTYQFLISGHTDSDGDGMYNVYLGQARAQTVMQYLIEQGVALQAIKTFTYGKSSPTHDNMTEEGKARNRRVEVILMKQ